jgi:hypothetical protein
VAGLSCGGNEQDDLATRAWRRAAEGGFFNLNGGMRWITMQASTETGAEK